MIAALVVSVLLLAANAFFVAAEFALVASRRHRLEEAAATGSRAARAAVRGSRELSLMLAGAQLGITLCTLALGALAKPAVADLLEPALAALGLPVDAAYVVAVVVAVAVVVFLHMVVGEMAPKSWAISDPERSALLLALPFRSFTWLARPALRVLNGIANGALRLVRVQPQDELAQVHGPDELRLLLAQSSAHGLLGEPDHRLLVSVLDLRSTRLTEVMRPLGEAVTVPLDATAAEVERVSLASGRSRLVVHDEGRPRGLVHVRDAVRSAGRGGDAGVRELMHRAETLPGELSLLEAVGRMRRTRSQLALVTAEGTGSGPGAGTAVGLVALEDLLERVLGEFEDETDHRGGTTPRRA